MGIGKNIKIITEFKGMTLVELSKKKEIDWVHIEDLVIEAERLDNEIKEEK